MKLLLLLSLLSSLTFAIPAPLIEPRAGPDHLIPGRYIVRIDVNNATGILKAAKAIVKKDFAHVYQIGDFGGFTVDMDDALLKRIRSLSGVRWLF
jgi:hypothetical protein